MPLDDFNSTSIDLVRTFEKFTSESNSKNLWKDHFGESIVRLVLGVVHGYNRKEDLGGIKLCLNHLLSKLKRKRYIWKIVYSVEDIGDSIKINKLEYLLIDSLIYSVIEFRDHLNEHHSGLSHIVTSKLIMGFELACLWSSTGGSLNPKINDFIVVRDNYSFDKYITSNH